LHFAESKSLVNGLTFHVNETAHSRVNPTIVRTDHVLTDQVAIVLDQNDPQKTDLKVIVAARRSPSSKRKW
jgi:hypothetical protein